MKHVTLLFLRRNGQILLAMKKRRFGAGMWNGAGGKVEPGETFEQAAIRECQEELDVTPSLLQKVGELHFLDLPGVDHYCHIYVTNTWRGEPQETEEMRPKWFDEDKIPYDQMWPDDSLWLPLLLDGKLFKGSITVNENTVQSYEIQEVSSL